MDTKVFEILAIDAKARCNDYAKKPMFDVYTIENLCPNEWDYSLPILTGGEPNQTITKLDKFIEKYKKYIPFEVDMANLLFAGGCISNIVTQKQNINDIDVFVYGIKNENGANAMINKFLKDICYAFGNYKIELEKQKNIADKKQEPKQFAN